MPKLTQHLGALRAHLAAPEARDRGGGGLTLRRSRGLRLGGDREGDARRTARRARSSSGGSTISQQLAKNLFLSGEPHALAQGPGGAHHRHDRARDGQAPHPRDLPQRDRVGRRRLRRGGRGAPLLRDERGVRSGPKLPRASPPWSRIRASTTATATPPGSRSKTADHPRAHARGGAAVTERHEAAAAVTPQENLEAVELASESRASAWWRTSRTARARTIRAGPSWSRAWSTSRTWRSCRSGSRRCIPADVAYVLEGLPLEDRLLVWGLVRSDRDGEILLEVSDAVRDTLLAGHGQRGDRRRDPEPRRRRDRRPRARPARGGGAGHHRGAGRRGSRGAAVGAFVPGGHGGRAHGLRGGEHPRGRDLRGGAALPAPLRRAAAPDRRALRGRSRRPPEGGACR